MTQFKKYLTMVASVGLVFSALTACTEEETIYVADLYQKAYITTDMYPRNEVVYRFSEITTVDLGYRMEYENGEIVIEQGNVSVNTTTAGATKYKVHFRTVYPVESALTGTLSVAANAEQIVADYNRGNGLSGEDAYEVLPAEYYTIEPALLTIQEGTSSATAEVQLSDNARTELNGHYLLPLEITLGKQTPVRGSEIELAEEMSRVNMVCDIIYRTVELESDGTIPRVLVPNTDFTYSSPYGFYDSYGYALSTLFDKNINTYPWSTSGNPVPVVIEFNEPVYLYKIGGIIGSNNSYAYYYGTPYSLTYTYEDSTEEIEGSRGDFGLQFGWYNINELLDPEKRVKSVKMTFSYGQLYIPSDLYLVAREKQNL